VATPFSVIVEDFDEGLTSLLQLIELGQSKSASARTRVATIHASTLMLAATFEEFVREMAREYAIQVVRKARRVSDLPDALLVTAWKRTFNELARRILGGRSTKEALVISAKEARPKVDALCAFIEGDTMQDIFADLIHNENNMRPNEINRMFKISGLSDVCSQICTQVSLKAFFDQEDAQKTHSDLLNALEEFFKRRNDIAHSLNSGISSGPEEVSRDIGMFLAFSRDLGTTLENQMIRSARQLRRQVDT